MFGSVAIQAAHGDLLHGLENAAHDMNAFTDVWVSPAGSYNLLQTAPFTPGDQAKLAAPAGGARGAALPRRPAGLARAPRWVIAPPRDASPLLPASQIVEGDVARPTARVRAGGWAVLSRAIAEEHHLHIGSASRCPRPVPTTLRVAALSTNIGWAPGAIVMNAPTTPARGGARTRAPTTCLLDPGASPPGSRARSRALGPCTGPAVQTAQQHARQQNALSRQGLARLTQIATLILVVAVLAMAAAMATCSGSAARVWRS